MTLFWTLLTTLAALCLLQVEQCSSKRIRKEWRTMSRKKKESFIKHFNNLATKNDPALKSVLQTFAEFNRPSVAPGAYRGPAFLPWHREYLLR